MNCGANSNNTPMCYEQEYVCDQGRAMPLQLQDSYWRSRYIRPARYTVGTYRPTRITFVSNRFRNLPGFRPRPVHIGGPHAHVGVRIGGPHIGGHFGGHVGGHAHFGGGHGGGHRGGGRGRR